MSPTIPFLHFPLQRKKQKLEEESRSIESWKGAVYRGEGKANQGQVCSKAVHRTDNPIETEGHYLKWHETRQLWVFPSITDNISNRYLLSTALVAEDVEVNNTKSLLTRHS